MYKTSKESLIEFKNKFSHLLASEEESHYRLKNVEGLHHPAFSILVSPTQEAELEQVVQFCHQKKMDYTLFGGGHNWGYGTAYGVKAHVVAIDLKNMNEIFECDEELGLVTIGPGVSQKQLFEYLESHNSKWMTPTTGAGPTGSLIGNALEKGFGLNIINDHFQSCVRLRVYLPELGYYESRLSALGAHKSDQVSKWKLGPYFEGLFAQSNLGIVTRATLQLGPKPKNVNFLMVTVSEAKFEKLIHFCQELHRLYFGSVFVVNISNRERLEATLNQHFEDSIRGQWEKKLIQKLGLHFDDYQVIIPLLEFNDSSKFIDKSIKKRARTWGLTPRYIKVNRYKKIINLLKMTYLAKVFPGAVSLIQDVIGLSWLIQGKPTDFALKLAYYKTPFNSKQEMDPARDGVGVLWFAPIVRLKFEDIDTVIKICDEVLPLYNMPKLYTFTNFDQKLTEATIPLFFDRLDSKSAERAHKCWEELYRRCLECEISPYRVPVSHMHLIEGQTKDIGSKIYQVLKGVVDPHRLQQEGRYEWGKRNKE